MTEVALIVICLLVIYVSEGSHILDPIFCWVVNIIF